MLRCKACDTTVSTYRRHCPSCGEEDTLRPQLRTLLIEHSDDTGSTTETYIVKTYSTGLPSLDAVFPPGLQSGNTVLIAAGPGMGKTTLCLQVAAALDRQKCKTLFVSGEMGAVGITRMLSQYRLTDSGLTFEYDGNFAAICERIRSENFEAIVVDSLQCLTDGRSQSPSYREQTSNSLTIRKLSKKYGKIFILIGQVRRDYRVAGPMSVIHNVDISLSIKKGFSSELIISAPEKNRNSWGAQTQCVLRKSPLGLIPAEERESGLLLRHRAKFVLGIAAFPAVNAGSATVDEMSATVNPAGGSLVIQGLPQGTCRFVAGVLESLFPGLSVSFVVHAARSSRVESASILAGILAILSAHYSVPLPITAAYIGSIDAKGNILSVTDMALRVERARAMGYTSVFGPVRIGNETANWIECSDIRELISKLDIDLRSQTILLNSPSMTSGLNEQA